MASLAQCVESSSRDVDDKSKVGELPAGFPSYLSKNRFAWVDETLGCMSQPLFKQKFRNALEKVGITTLVNLQGEWNDDMWRDHYKKSDGRLTIFRIRIPDHKRATPEQLRSFIAICDDARQRGTRVVAHCWRGHGRTSQMVAAYLVSRGVTADAAIAQAQALRTDADRREKPSSEEVTMHPEQADAVRELAISFGGCEANNKAELMPEPLYLKSDAKSTTPATTQPPIIFEDVLIRLCEGYNYTPICQGMPSASDERPVMFDNETLRKYRERRPPSGATCEICMEDVRSDDGHDWCKSLCACGSSWTHSNCAAKKFNMGYNGQLVYLLKCGGCRGFMLGDQCGKWLDKAANLLNQFDDANKSHEEKKADAEEAKRLAMDTVGFLIRHGSGTNTNVLLGTTIFHAAAALHHLDCSKNGGVPTELASGQYCLDAVKMGGQPRMSEAYVLEEMTHACESEAEKHNWLDLAAGFVERCKQVIPKTEGELLKDVEFVALRLKLKLLCLLDSSTDSLPSLLAAVEGWSSNVRVLDASSCYFVCRILAKHGGLRNMGEFYEHGVREDPHLFHVVTEFRQSQMESDLVELRGYVLAESTTNEQRVHVGEETWKWRNEELTDVDMLDSLRSAYKEQGLELLFDAKFGEKMDDL